MQTGIVDISGYKEKVAGKELFNLFLRKKGAVEGKRIFYELYYVFGIDDLGGPLNIPELDATLNGFLMQGQISQAVTYLRGL